MTEVAVRPFERVICEVLLSFLRDLGAASLTFLQKPHDVMWTMIVYIA